MVNYSPVNFYKFLEFIVTRQTLHKGGSKVSIARELFGCLCLVLESRIYQHMLSYPRSMHLLLYIVCVVFCRIGQ